ncbi:MAG: ABC transporter permease [Acidobacteriia bacterium]|nr:ABC transporter permease [Terriglobia bacterium]
MDHLLQDLRHGLRLLAKSPGFTVVAVLTLALGIGANTAIFSLVNAVLLNPLAFPRESQLVVLTGQTHQEKRTGISYPEFEDWRRQSRSFSALSTWMTQSVNLTGVDEPQRVRGGFVSANFFDLLGIRPAQGRAFLKGEDQPGRDRVAVVNYSLWQTRFGADPGLVGKQLILNGAVFTVIGILPQTFEFPLDKDRDEIWMPVSSYPNFSRERSTYNLVGIGRLGPDATLSQAQVEMNTISQRLAEEYPDTDGQRHVVVALLHEVAVEEVRTSLLVLFAAVGFVLLIACANVSNLMLARAAGRRKEMALRSALGASRGRLILQMLTESVLLWLVGGALGLLAGNWGLHAIQMTAPLDFPPGIVPHLDGLVFGFTWLVAVLTGILSGLVPAFQFSRPDLNHTLKEGGRVSDEGSSRKWSQKLLLVSQVALSLVLLVGAGLMLKTVIRLSRTDPGFHPENLLTLEYRLPETKYPKAAEQWNFHREVVERVSALRGVQSAAVSLGIPFSGNFGSNPVVLLDRPEPPPGEEPIAETNLADTHYFETMGIPLIKGRWFFEHDEAGAPHVAVINQNMARRYWPGRDPVGQQIQLRDELSLFSKEPATIIGIVDNVKQQNLEDPASAQIYFAFKQNPNIFATLTVRTQADPMLFANTVRRAVWSVDKDQPMWKVRSLESMLDHSLGARRYLMFLLSIYAALALGLATLGIYGVLSYAVNQRFQEIGVRMALGAQTGDVLRLVIRDGMQLVLAGLGIGLLGALSLTRLMAGLLFEVTPTDLSTIAAVSALLAGVAFLGCYLPARRATRVDPMAVLRCE